MTKTNHIIEICNITKSFPDKVVLDDVSLNVRQGEFLTILGPSGCGKTTLLRLIAGFNTATSGRIFIDGKDMTAVPPHQRPVNTVFQRYALFPHLNVYENVNISKEIIKGGFSSEEVLKLVGLQNHLHKFPSQLSGGQQQRVAIARALSKDPTIILGDEPTGALDTNTGIMVMALLQRLCWKLNKTIVIVTHNPEYANYADRIIYMKNGKIDRHLINDSPLEVVV